MSDKELKLTALTVEQLTRLLSRSGTRVISESEVAMIAANLSDDEKINLVEFTAFLAKEVAGGAD